MLYLVGCFILFIIILIVVTIIVFSKSKPDTCKINPKVKKEKVVSLEMLVKTVKNSKSELSEMEEALSIMVKKFPFPENESEANQYFEFVYFFSKNPLSTAKLIVKMQKALSKRNPQYIKQIEEFQMLGVEARI
ncbi:MAG TPA: hypothetical protein EYO73_08955 [Sulfurimonas sp.]|nr:hypothetical protein [Sulfurimonas sp.]